MWAQASVFAFSDWKKTLGLVSGAVWWGCFSLASLLLFLPWAGADLSASTLLTADCFIPGIISYAQHSTLFWMLLSTYLSFLHLLQGFPLQSWDIPASRCSLLTRLFSTSCTLTALPGSAALESLAVCIFVLKSLFSRFQVSQTHHIPNKLYFIFFLMHFLLSFHGLFYIITVYQLKTIPTIFLFCSSHLLTTKSCWLLLKWLEFFSIMIPTWYRVQLIISWIIFAFLNMFFITTRVTFLRF